MDNMEISPIRAKALAIFAAALNAVLNTVPFTLPSGTVPKSPLVKKDAFGKKDKGGKSPLCQTEMLSRPQPSFVLRQPPSPRPLGKRHGSKATAQ